MKTSMTLACLILSISVFGKDLSSKKELLADVKAETKKCAVPLTVSNNGNPRIVGFKSICKSLTDGGDLDDLVITDAKGKILATKTNIPAYDSVIVAMAGDSDFGKTEELN